MKKIFVTAISWDEQKEASLRSAISSAKSKYPDLTIVVGYTAISLKIAMICADENINTQMIAPDILAITGDHITTIRDIAITSTTRAEYCDAVTKNGKFGISGIIAFDDGDPIILKAIANGIRVWFPMAGKMA